MALTRAGMVAERITRAFWPAWTIAFVVLGVLIAGWQDHLPLELFWALAVFAATGLGWALWRGARAFRWPSREEAIARVDAALPGRPLSALSDEQAVGAGDDASAAVWRAHVDRMRERSRAAHAVDPDLRVSAADRFGLRYMAVIFFVAALIFGSILRIGSVSEMAPGTGGQTLATGPVWEGWVEPPAYTGKPTLYLNDIPPGAFEVPEGSKVTLRLYGDPDALTVVETLSDGDAAPVEVDAPMPAGGPQSFTVAHAGRLAIEGEGGAEWQISVLADNAPTVEIAGEVQVEAMGEMSQPFRATDDYGVTAGRATITLDLEAVERRYGLVLEPEPREPVVVDLPMPFAGDRSDFTEALVDDFSQHPWANLPVTLTLRVEDALGQSGAAEPYQMTLPGRRFFEPVAKAVIEIRRDILWSKENAARAADLLQAIAYRPEEGLIRSETSYLRLSVIARRMDAMGRFGMSDDGQAEMAEALWDLAVQLEDGTLADARERLRRAQERLAEAMRNGASEEEIAELMQELREAVNDYTRMLAEQSEPQDGTDQPQSAEGETFELTQDELQALMDRIQELMEEGRMAEAQELMDQLNQLMENLQVTQGQGQGQPSPGQQSMQDLAETLRDQQGLSDEAFRDLQEQFGEQQGQQPGQQQPGQQPGQQQPGEGQPGQQPGQGGDEDLEGTLADRQEALRRELDRQRGELPNLGGEAAEEARRQLGRAEESMDGAEDALREGDLPGALDRQSEAMDALREGIRELGRALAENEQEGQPGQGQQQGDATGQVQPSNRDPLGRQLGESGQFGTDENLLQDEDIYRRAEELLQELRRRSSDRGRPQEELDYLERLLKRF